jgi:hypothetical protein
MFVGGAHCAREFTDAATEIGVVRAVDERLSRSLTRTVVPSTEVGVVLVNFRSVTVVTR